MDDKKGEVIPPGEWKEYLGVGKNGRWGGMIKVHDGIEMSLWSLSIWTVNIPIKFYVKAFKMDHVFILIVLCLSFN